jgi:hypothetical protein
MQDAVGTPIDALSGHIEGMTSGMQALAGSLSALQAEIASERAQAAAAAQAVARVSTLQAKAEKFDGNWGSKSLSKTEGLKDKLQDLVASTGVSLSGINLSNDGTLSYSSSGISGTASQLAAFRDAGFWDQGGLQDQIAAANDNRQRAVAYQERLQENIRNAMTVPGFASGGDHLGGWRVVGEKGWELENTGPSRVVSNSDSKAMLDNRQVVAVLQEVLAALSAMGASTTKGLSEVAKHTADLAKLERGRELFGVPQTRQEV